MMKSYKSENNIDKIAEIINEATEKLVKEYFI